MPIYEYVCITCGQEFETLQKFSDKPLTECTCGKMGRVERKLSLSAFQLKGGGWYKEGYSSASGGNGSSGNGKVGKPDAVKPEGKPESKDGSSTAPAEKSSPTSAASS